MTDTQPTSAASTPVLAPGAAQTIETWPYATVLEVAAAVCRERAKESFRLHRDVAAATREASQLTHLAIRLDSMAAERRLA